MISGDLCEYILSSAMDGQEMAEEWVDMWNFPNGCVAIDGVNVSIKKPKSGVHYNYKANDDSKRVMFGFFNVDHKFMSLRVPLEMMHIHDRSILMNTDMRVYKTILHM